MERSGGSERVREKRGKQRGGEREREKKKAREQT